MLRENKYDSLITSLCQTVHDYRKNEQFCFTPSHVRRWVNQFDPSDQQTILEEMNVIMAKFYFSEATIKALIRKFIKDHLVGKNNPEYILPRIEFLRIQQKGLSQAALLNIVEDIISEEYQLSIHAMKRHEKYTYVYIDDAIYTGNKLRYDLTNGVNTHGWIEDYAIPNSKLIIYTIAAYLKGARYALDYVISAAQRKNISVTVFRSLLINDSRSVNNNVDVLWPEKLSGYALLDQYIDNIYTINGHVNNLFYSPVREDENLFSSSKARRLVEKAFLLKGLELINTSKNRAQSVRPLGFMKLPSLGFGTFFVSYRNISNNCPLVLWWGDPSYPQTHPLGKWYPLFPRTVNETRYNTI